MKQLAIPVLLVFLAACGGDKDKKNEDEAAGSEAAGENEAAGETAAAGETPDEGKTKGPLAAAALGDVPVAGWVRFELAEHNFAVALPKKPGPPDVTPVQTEVGVGEAKVFMIMDEPFYYGLGVVTMPQVILDQPEPMGADAVKAAFDGGTAQMLSAINGTKTGERDLEVKGLPAREVTYTVSVQGQRVEGLARMIADPETKNIYQLQILSDRPVAEASKPFFDSFELLSQKD